MGKTFSPFEVMDYPIHFLRLKCEQLYFIQINYLILAMKLKLGHNISQLTHRFKIGVFWVSVGSRL